jgi:dynein heavy chain 1
VFTAHRGSGGAAASASQQERESYDNVLKKLSELNLSLVQCLQRVEIPPIKLEAEREVRERVQSVEEKEHRLATEEDFSDLLTDDAFIARLANSVRRWMKDIMTVVSMEHDIANGTTMQEVQFWISKEAAMQHIDAQIKRPEVTLTIALLEARQQRLVTIPFKQDLNFKQRLAHTQ